MKYYINPKLPKRAYLQLYEALREDIVEGRFSYGDRLPSKRVLAEEVGVSLVTAEHAYTLLCEEGYAEARERFGYFVAFRDMENFAVPTTRAVPFSTPVSLQEETALPFSVYARTARRVLGEYGEGLLVKSPNQGSEELRRELSRYLARSRGIFATPEQIVIGSGAEYLYGLTVQLFGTECLYGIEDPSYEKISLVYHALGAECEELPLGCDGIESEALQKSRASVLHITPYRSFPSGVTASAAKKREYLRWAKGKFIVEDDFESEFSLSRKPEDSLFSMSREENVIYMNSFTKTVAPAIRVGYMVLPKSLLPLFEEKIGFYSCTVPCMEQQILACLLAEGEFERHINRVRRRLRQKQGNEI